MGLDEFQHLADFDFVKHFGIITHTVQLDNINWKTREMLNDLSQGFEAIKCNFCDKNAVIFTVGKRAAYWEKHTEEYGMSTQEVEDIERITNRLKEIVENMYKYLIFVQERIHFIKLDRFEALFYTTTVDIDSLNDKLNSKINSFHTIIQTLKESWDIELLFVVITSLNDIKDFAWDIINKIYDLLKEEFKESFCKSINNDWDVNYSNDYQYEEETKRENLSHQPEDNIYKKPLIIFVGDFLSSLKVLNLQDEIKDLFKYSVKMTNSFEECKKVNTLCIFLKTLFNFYFDQISITFS